MNSFVPTLLLDTGALQSLVCSRVLTDGDYKATGEFRLIRGVTGNVISIPLVEITLRSSLCNGSYLCGLVSTLADGIAVLVGNGICADTHVTDVTVVTRSQTAQQHQATSQKETSCSDVTVKPSTTLESPGLSNEDDYTYNLSPTFDETAVE